MFVTDLKSRAHKILETIIQSYVESAEPVGSEFLCRKYRFGVSPATIRNVMGRLERMELITHPHTSAGRIPTDRGYRYYVDLLMQPSRLRPEEEEAIQILGEREASGTEEFLSDAMRLLSELTAEAAVALVPQLSQGSFRHLELIPVAPNEVVGVLILSEGLIRHSILELKEPMVEEELQGLTRFLNQELSGMPLAYVSEYLERALLESTSAFFHLYKRAKELLSVGRVLEEEPSLILEGARWVLQAPEFQEIHRTQRLIQGLESKQELAGILIRDLSANEVRFHIGSENRNTLFTDCTIAAAPYRLRGGVFGAIGVIGPTRIDYPRVAALVGRFAQELTRYF